MQDGSKRLRILLLEDHPDTSHALANLLSREAHRVRCVQTGAEALQAATEQSFDLLISDLRLPDISGFDVMRKMKEMYGTIGIAVTGLSSERDMSQATAAGFSRYLIKPILWDVLKRTIAELVDESRV